MPIIGLCRFALSLATTFQEATFCEGLQHPGR